MTLTVGHSEDALDRAILLTAICVVVPLLEILYLFAFIGFHPPVKDKEFKQCIKLTEEKFFTLMKSLLLDTNVQHHKVLFKSWLLMKEMNVNNYGKIEEEVKEKTHFFEDIDIMKKEGGVKVEIAFVKTEVWILEFLNNALDPEPKIKKVEDITTGHLEKVKEKFENPDKSNKSVTPMMGVIEYHVRMVTKTSRLKQLNLGFEASEETKLRRKRLPFERVVDVLRTMDDRPCFPSVLNYSVVRELKDKPESTDDKWMRERDGTPLNSEILSEEPWFQLRQQSRSYLRSFILDLLIHWLKIWISLVLLDIIFAEEQMLSLQT